MTAYAFRRDAGEFACDAWRPLDRAVYRWVLAHRGSPLLAKVAAWASLADGQGDSALPLDGDGARHGMPPLDGDELAHLCAEAMVASDDEAALRPFVIDGANRFYLRRNHAHEARIAECIALRRDAAESAGGVDEHDLDLLFQGRRDEAVQAQREAVARVVGRRLFVLTGGPGTGKTTTVLRMLAMLQRCSPQPLTMRAAAPTGKAAQRLVDALRQGRERLLTDPGTPLPADWRDSLQSLPDREALTLHRLLGYDPQRNAFRRTRRNPIAADVVVIDEASMIDLAMLRALLDAVPAHARLILVGDADQLTSVAAGSALMDLVAAMEARPRGDLVRLRYSFRAERHLVDINEAVRMGDAAALEAAIDAAGLYAARQVVETPAHATAELVRWATRLAGLESLRGTACAEGAEAARAALDALGRLQLLCALRDGPFGAIHASRVIEQHLRRAWGHPDGVEWYPGRAVMITHNDYAMRLFNGDVGVCLAGPDGHLRVWFESAGDAAGLREFAPGALPPNVTAFAVTVHKSQGSEYERVAVLLPPDADHRILSRQLLYTGVSRARDAVEIWAGDGPLAAALARPVQRNGGLADRLERSDLSPG